MSSLKILRINSELEKTLSNIILSETNDEFLKTVTITSCDVSKDLSYAKVYFTTMSDMDQKQAEKEEDARRKAEAEEIAKELETKRFTFKVNSGAEGRVFGSVSTKQIVEELHKNGYKVDKRKILDTAPIVSLGVTKVRVELYKGVIAKIKIELIKK